MNADVAVEMNNKPNKEIPNRITNQKCWADVFMSMYLSE